MASPRRVFSKDLKLSILQEIDAGATIAQVARAHSIHPETIRMWRRTERKFGDRAFAGNGNAYTDDARIAELERTIGQQAHEIRLLKKAQTLLKELGSGNAGKR
jgi:transposase